MTGLGVEAVLREHERHHGDEWCPECLCGWLIPSEASDYAAAHRAHVAAVLRVEIESALADVLRDAADEWPEDGMTRSEAQRFLAQRADQIAPYRPSLAATEGD